VTEDHCRANWIGERRRARTGTRRRRAPRKRAEPRGNK
jgi:hypothetical protein